MAGAPRSFWGAASKILKFLTQGVSVRIGGGGQDSGQGCFSVGDGVAPVQMLVEFQARGNVAAPIAVVRSAPNCYQRIVEHVPGEGDWRSEMKRKCSWRRRPHELVALHHQLMRAADEVNFVRRVELKQCVMKWQYIKIYAFAQNYTRTCCTISPPKR